MDIIVVNTDGVEFSSLEKYLGCVSEGRRKAVLAKKNEEQRVQSLVGGLLLRSEIAKRTGLPISRQVFEKGAHGKPYLKGARLQFSLSHTNGAVCAAFSDDGEIGVDIERRDRRVTQPLKAKVLCENERAQVLSDEDFVRVWVKKEAFLKRTGIGLATKLCGADTTMLPDLTVLDCGEYFVGAAGKGAAGSLLTVIPVDELLVKFDAGMKK